MKISKMKYIFLGFGLLSIQVLKAQKVETIKIGGLITVIKGLPVQTVGDQVPDFKINKIINYPGGEAKMSDFKDKLVIFDFWRTYCAGCIAALPHMEALQKEFGDQIKILPVTFENEGKIKEFWKNNNYTKNLKLLPTVVEDSILHGIFPNIIVPHEVFVYKGKVIGITNADYVKADNIKQILNGEQMSWPIKNDFYVFDRSKPIFSIDSNRLNTKNIFLKYAAISDYKPGVNTNGLSGARGIVRNIKNKTVRAYIVNEPIFTAYVMNWSEALGYENAGLVKPNGDVVVPFNENEVIWEVADKTKYKLYSKLIEAQSFMVKNAICFESLNPDTGQTDKQIYLSIIKDMNRLLGLNVRWEKRKERVLVLVRTTKEDKLKSKETIKNGIDQYKNITGAEHYKQIGSLYQFRSINLPVAGRMNGTDGNPYVFDETGYTDLVDMDLNIPSWTDLTTIRKAIAPYGLALKEEERSVDKFVFSEVNGGLLVDGVAQAAAEAKRNAQKEMKVPGHAEQKQKLYGSQ